MDFKVIDGNNFAEIAVQIIQDAAFDLLVKKELALRAADAIGMDRRLAEKDIDEVLHVAARLFEEENFKDRIKSSIIVQKK